MSSNRDGGEFPRRHEFTDGDRVSDTAAEQHCGHCDGLLVWGFNSYVHADPNTDCLAFGGRQLEPATPTPAQDAPPERIWVDLKDALGGGKTKYAGYWYRKQFEPTDIEYILRSTHDAEIERLKAALRGVRRYEVAGLPCYCETRRRDRAADDSDFYERKSDDDHSDACAAARAALSGKEKDG